MYRSWQPVVYGVTVQITVGWLIIVTTLTAITIYTLLPADVDPATRTHWYFAVTIVTLGTVASIGLHDTAHVVAARNSERPVLAVSPQLAGALPDTLYEADSPRNDFRVALAGPLVNVIAGSLLGLAWWGSGVAWSGVIVSAVGVLALVNGGLALLNLMPGYPFDGGRVLRAFIWYLTDDVFKATKYTGFYGYVLVLIGLAGGLFLVAAGREYAIWGAWVVLTFWMINRSVSAGVSHVFWVVNSRRLRVDDIFVGGTRRLQCSTTIDDAIERLLEAYQDGPTLVVDGDEAVGIVDLKAIRPVPRSEWTRRTIGEVKRPLDGYPRVDTTAQLSQLVEVLPPDTPAVALLERNGTVIGAADRQVVLRRLQEYLSAERLEQLRTGRNPF